ncbi:hypothetical protein [Sediminicola luteus]|uniref:O-antigen polymerase n=1 Tax=Sediminicola luteus TaxID=319238 RepID=A0ABV2TV66_9FLAO
MEILKLNKEDILVLIFPLIFLFNGVIPYLLLILCCIISLSQYLKQDKILLYTLLLINSYHLFGQSIYKNNFLFISIIYFLIIILFLVEIKSLKKIPQIIIPFIAFFFIRIGLGVYFNFTIKYALVETILFLSFAFFLLLFYNNQEDHDQFLKTLKKYVLYYFPYLTLISFLKGEMIDLKPYFLDEFSHFYLISIFPIILFTKASKNTKIALTLFHLIFIFIRIKYLYISSFAFIGAGLAILLIITTNFSRIYKYVAVICLIIISFLFIMNYASVFGKHKIDQITQTITVLKDIQSVKDLKKIPNSPKTRIIEVLNINKELYQSGAMTVFFGKGFGSYFTDENYSFKDFNVRLDDSAFSEIELIKEKFMRPHNTIPYIFLKMGYSGLFFILFIIIYVFLKIPKNDWLMYSFIPYFLILFGAGLKNFIIMGILLGIIFNYSKNKVYES